MKKHLLLLLLTLLAMVARADDSGSCGDNVTWTFNETVQTLTFSGSGEIPGVRKWFKYESSIKRIIIEEGITSIGNDAFAYCKTFSIIDIPNSVTSIGSSAFQGCSSLSSITIPNSVTTIGNFAFQKCSGLSSITIGNNVTNIDDCAFYECTNITSVHISDIEAWCKINFCNDYFDRKTSSANPLYYAKHLFLNGEELKDVMIPNSIKEIGTFTFQYCTGLTSVTIPKSIEIIKNNAFYNCENLMTVRSDLTEPFNCDNLFNENTYRKGTLYVPAGTKDLYARFDGWREFLRIEEVGGEPQKFQLSFVVNNKELSHQETEVGATITPPAKDNNGNTISWYTYPETMPAHDLVVYGMVPKPDAPTKYTITYMLDGQTYRSIVMEEGATVSKETAPYKEGYTFSGWQNEPMTMPGRDVTVNGTFSVNSYSLKFVVDNTELSTQSVQYGSTINVPTKDNEGNDVSWYTSPSTMPAHDLVIYGIAVIQPKPEVFVWLTVKDGQSGTTKIEVKQGTEQRLNINPEEGWKLSAIMMDNDDVTAQLQSDGTFVTPALMSDATLTIVYEQETPSGVRTTTHSQADVKVVSDGVVISNAEPDTRCVVYQTDGQQVVNAVINEGTRKITLQKGEAYILSIDGRTLKFAL